MSEPTNTPPRGKAMTFVSSKVFETEEQESARLAQSPPGSINHALSKLPVNIKQYPKDLVIQLPWTREEPQHYIMVVVPIEHTPQREGYGEPIRVHSGWWTCAVVYSSHESYGPGGHRIVVGADELARGALLNIQHVTYPGSQV